MPPTKPMTWSSTDRMHVVVTGYNVEGWIDRCLESVQRQTWQHFSCAVVDDASTDATRARILQTVGGDDRFVVKRHAQRRWATAARQTGLAALAAQDHEIVVLLDGDDWFFDDSVLARIRAVHLEKEVLATYGGMVVYGGEPIVERPYPRWVRLAADYRAHPWCAFPARSFRYALWRHVGDDELLDASGSYYRFATDIALFLPILELAGPRTAFVDQPLYVYNRSNPLNCSRVDPTGQHVAFEILAKPAKRPLPREQLARLLQPRDPGGTAAALVGGSRKAPDQPTTQQGRKCMP